jgi:phosphatidylglycerophosphate synthase
VNKIVVGRSGDLVDGFIARLLDQQTDTGAFVDTAADKTGMAAITIAAWRKKAIPRVPLTVIAGKQALNVGLTAMTAHNHPGQSFRPNPYGKQAMAADNATYIGYLYSHALERDQPELNLHQGFAMLGRTAFAAGSALSVPATLEYADRAFRK